MTTLREAAQQALEAMRRAVPTGEITLADWMKANRDLKAALAEPVQRPSDTAFDLWWDDALDGPTPIAPVSKETAQWIWNAANTERVHGIGESNE